MKLQLSQSELSQFTQAGKTSIWQYKTLYQVDYSPNIGKGEYYLREVGKHSHKGGLGVTQKGRFIAMTTEEAIKYR